MTDLSLVTVDEMMDELAKRATGALLLLTYEEGKSKIADASDLAWFSRGGMTLAMGAAWRFLHAPKD